MKLPDLRALPLRSIAGGAAALAFVGFVASGILVVDPAEVAVVTRFGAVNRTLGAGLGFRIPVLEADQRIRVTEVRRVELPSVRLLTEDTNLIDLALIVQYKVEDPVLYALVHADPEKVVAAEVASAADARVAEVAVDALLTTGRTELQQSVMEQAQKSLDALATGVRLVAIDVGNLAPPEVVVNAFNDVSSAKGDQDTTRLAADAYASKVIPDVRGKAAQAQEEALGTAAQISAKADGDIARFQAILPAWRAAPEATRAQLREQMWADIGEKAKIEVVPPGAQRSVE